MDYQQISPADRLTAIREARKPKPKKLTPLEQIEFEIEARRMAAESAKANQERKMEAPRFASTEEAIAKLNELRRNTTS